MGQCLCCKRPKDSEAAVSDLVLKQDKNIDDKRMFKLGIDVLNRDFCVQIGYNRKAVKTYGKGHRNTAPQGMTETVIPQDEDVVS